MRSIGHLDKENAKRRSSWAGEEVSESFLLIHRCEKWRFLGSWVSWLIIFCRT